MIKRLLIANRGEIACRIIRSARKSSIETLAVYSEPDKQAQHVLQADHAFSLGGKTAAESYLNKDKIIAIALENKADAIHPGYGFLAEDGDFSRAVKKAGLIFVGPSGDNIDLMGNKEQAKTCASEAGLPIAKDYRGDSHDKKRVAAAAKDIGFPLLVKASAGGGGKGMRLVQESKDLNEAIDAAAREAEASFGNPAVFLEQYIRPARHIEVQIAFDEQGNGVHLYTRDCSIQRRHQKVIEEAPAHIPKDVESAMCAASLNLARHISYTGLGTLEFLLDKNNAFYFMEMNTRLQVEHPVSEMITGLDCIAMQLEIASGKNLSVQQKEITCTGHAIEARICAEIPLQNFIPSTGRLAVFQTPIDARFDTGVVEGDEISPFYDSMIAKVISYGEDRAQAIELLYEALCETHIVGPSTNVEFINAIIQTKDFRSSPSFRKGEALSEINTEFIQQHLDELKQHITELSDDEIAACAHAYLEHKAQQEKPPYSNDYFSPWVELDSWRPQGSKLRELTIQINQKPYAVTPMSSTLCGGSSEEWIPDNASRFRDDAWESYANGDCLHVFFNGKEMRVAMGMHYGDISESASSNSILSTPMPGTVTQVLVKTGDTVEIDQTLVCIEAMKMEHAIKAPKKATVKAVHVAEGDTTRENQDLVELDF